MRQPNEMNLQVKLSNSQAYNGEPFLQSNYPSSGGSAGVFFQNLLYDTSSTLGTAVTQSAIFSPFPMTALGLNELELLLMKNADTFNSANIIASVCDSTSAATLSDQHCNSDKDINTHDTSSAYSLESHLDTDGLLNTSLILTPRSHHGEDVFIQQHQQQQEQQEQLKQLQQQLQQSNFLFSNVGDSSYTTEQNIAAFNTNSKSKSNGIGCSSLAAATKMGKTAEINCRRGRKNELQKLKKSANTDNCDKEEGDNDDDDDDDKDFQFDGSAQSDESDDESDYDSEDDHEEGDEEVLSTKNMTKKNSECNGKKSSNSSADPLIGLGQYFQLQNGQLPQLKSALPLLPLEDNNAIRLEFGSVEVNPFIMPTSFDLKTVTPATNQMLQKSTHTTATMIATNSNNSSCSLTDSEHESVIPTAVEVTKAKRIRRKPALTEEERKLRRRERNRVAAVVCRQRKQKSEQEVRSRLDLVLRENDALATQLKETRDMLSALRAVVKNHLAESGCKSTKLKQALE